MSSIPTWDNPAARLEQILRSLSEQSVTSPIHPAWILALGLDSQAEISDVMRGVAGVIELPAQILRELHRDPDAAEQGTFTRWIEPVSKALQGATNLEGPVQAVTQRIDEGVLTSLGAVAFVLHRQRPRTRVDDDSMHALLEQLLNLEGEVSSGDFDEDLKLVLLDQLAQMQQMIRMFRVRGTAAFRDAASFGAGAVAAAVTKDPAAHPTLKKIWGFVMHLSTVAQMGESSLAIAGEVAKMVGGG